MSKMPDHMIERLKCMEEVFYRPKAVDIPWTSHGEEPAFPGLRRGSNTGNTLVFISSLQTKLQFFFFFFFGRRIFSRTNCSKPQPMHIIDPSAVEFLSTKDQPTYG